MKVTGSSTSWVSKLWARPMPSETSAATAVSSFFICLLSVCSAISSTAWTMGIPAFRMMANWEQTMASSFSFTRGPNRGFACRFVSLTSVIFVTSVQVSFIFATAAYSSKASTTPLTVAPSLEMAVYLNVCKGIHRFLRCLF